MKKFFMSFLGTLAGIWFSALLLFVGFFIVLSAAVASGSKDTSVKISDNTVLHLQLNGIINDRQEPVDIMAQLQGNDIPAQSLNEIIGAIEKAAEDDKISGILIDCSGSSAGMAQRQAIYKALKDFRKKSADKWVYAYSDSYVQGDYLIAAAADSLFINPIGEVDIHGLSATTLYYKDLMDKIGVEAQVVKVGTYKSAVEPFLLNGMSEASREQQQLYLGNIWNELAGQIAECRNVSIDTVNSWADSFIFAKGTPWYISHGIVDRALYRHQLDEKIKKVTGEDNPVYMTPSEYCKSVDINKVGKGKGATIAVLYATGDITTNGKDGIASERLVPEILKLAENDDIDALVMRVNSGGGSAFASEQIWEALEQFKAMTGNKKPFYVSMGDYAASGGYYISCGADKIYAEPVTLTGSIGIFGIIPNANKLITEKIGVKTGTVSTNANGDFPSLIEPMTASQRAAMQSYVDRGYELFTSRCANGRNMPVDSIKKIAEGRVWDGTEALKIGLVDKLGGLDAAIADIASQLGAEGSYTVTEFPAVELKWYDAIFAAGLDVKESIVRSALGENASLYETLERVKGMSTLQCRMETVEIR
ncbi:MAG: signal peptide peptidase SppA [Duncaniella sp.]|nr:signal peptide peptidase SppA [Duncaniella sp.]